MVASTLTMTLVAVESPARVAPTYWKVRCAEEVSMVSPVFVAESERDRVVRVRLDRRHRQGDRVVDQRASRDYSHSTGERQGVDDVGDSDRRRVRDRYRRS